MTQLRLFLSFSADVFAPRRPDTGRYLHGAITPF